MKVREVLRTKPAAVVTVEPELELAKAARMLIERGIGGLPVVRAGGEVIGFLSERDVVRAVQGHGGDVARVPVRVAMRRPAPTCSADDAIREVMARMTRDRLRHLVVLEEGRIVGVLSVGDLVKHRLEQLETEAGVLRDYVVAQRARG